MIILGLTGSIGMGKTTVANHFRYLRIPVYDADQTVHNLLRSNDQVFRLVKQKFPETTKSGFIDRKLLGDEVFKNLRSLETLEKILHPFVKEKKNRFLQICLLRRERLAVLDIPLLYEKNGYIECDVIVVTSAPSFVQDFRVLKRPGMTPKKYKSILATQISDKEKRKRADYIINSNLGKRESLRATLKIIKAHTISPKRRKRIFRRSIFFYKTEKV